MRKYEKGQFTKLFYGFVLFLIVYLCVNSIKSIGYIDSLGYSWIFFFWIWLISLIVLFIINIFREKQKKVDNEKRN